MTAKSSYIAVIVCIFYFHCGRTNGRESDTVFVDNNRLVKRSSEVNLAQELSDDGVSDAKLVGDAAAATPLSRRVLADRGCLAGEHRAKGVGREIAGPAAKPFRVVWNAPTESCQPDFGVDVDVKKYGILENRKDGWFGRVISIFYQNDIGLCPYVTANGTLVNGGIPQLADFPAHYRKAQRDIIQRIPDPEYSGLGVLDWEAWRPIFLRNYDTKLVYQNLSIELVRKQHPTWTRAQIVQEAQCQFETAARKLMEGTLDLAQTLRGGGLWGFYLFPDCYDHQGQRRCSNETMQLNDRLMWLFNSSTVLYPSGYLKEPDQAYNKDIVHAKVTEAQRIQKKLQRLKHTDVPIYMYSRFQYAKDFGHFFSKNDLRNSLTLAKALGVDGVILWDDKLLARSKATCLLMKDYLDSTLGPFVQDLLPSI